MVSFLLFALLVEVAAQANDDHGSKGCSMMQTKFFEPASISGRSTSQPVEAQSASMLQSPLAERDASAAQSMPSSPRATAMMQQENKTAHPDLADHLYALPMMSFIDGPIGGVQGPPSAKEAPPKDAPPVAPVDMLFTPSVDVSSFAGLFDSVRFTVVRIRAIVSQINWLQPHLQLPESTSIGSGFVVDDGNGDFVILTNAHVVKDAHVVQVQLPAVGQTVFDAYVPLLCGKFDLAVVQLKQPNEFLQTVRQYNGSMDPLKIQPTNVNLGLEVAAFGFPLGSSSLKLSRGIISGTETVYGSTCYQTTAPISPGSSGGPLFATGPGGGASKVSDLRVIGVNFASSASQGAQNVNYVVPAIRLSMVLNEFHQVKADQAKVAKIADKNTGTTYIAKGSGAKAGKPSREEKSKYKQHTHKQLRIAPIDAFGVEASDALYNTSGGCRKGVFLSRILPASALRFAKPSVPEKSFLTAIDNVSLDNFGMGRTDAFLGDPTPFQSLMTLRDSVDDPITLSVCHLGKETKHIASIRWRSEYTPYIKDVEEPHFEDDVLDFEVFAGVTIMQMTVNHIEELLRHGRPRTLSRWMLVENQEQPRLIVTDVNEGTYASRVLSPGMVVQQVNGNNVSCLLDYRKAFRPSGLAWTLETDRGMLLSVKFKETLTEQVSLAESSPEKQYLLSPALLQVATELRLLRTSVVPSKGQNEKSGFASKNTKPLSLAKM